MSKQKRFEKMVADGMKAKQMYAPVKVLSARQYDELKKREQFGTAGAVADNLINQLKDL